MKINGFHNLNFFQLFFYKCLVFFGVFFLIIGAGCTTLELNKAFDGEFNGVENNRLINTYCTSCHNHKLFDSESHVLQVRQKYKRRLFRRTSECRTCHYLEKAWAADHTFRKTRGYKKANRGGFRTFEKKILEESRFN
jgi:hypothetical protein